MQFSRSALMVLALSGALVSSSALAQVTIDIPLAVGFPAPGLPGATVQTLRTPTTNDFSVKAMVGTVSGAGITASNNTALWRVGTVAELVVRTGQTIAGLPSGVTLGSIETPSVNNLGTTIFTGTLTGPGVSAVNNRAMFTGRPRNVRLVARTGDQAPGLAANQVYASFDAPRLSDNDKVVFSGSISGPGINLGTSAVVSYGDASMLQIVARTGFPAPGTTGATFAILGDPVVSPTGKVLFSAVLNQFIGGVTSNDDVGVWSGTPGSMVLARRGGEQTPILTYAGVLDSFSSVSTNEDDSIAYSSALNPRLPNTAVNSLLVVERLGQVNAIAQTGLVLAPGVLMGTIGAPRMSGLDNTAFLATVWGSAVTPSSDTAVFMKIGAELTMLARKGSLIAAIGNGVRFGDFLGVIVNRTGRVVFSCRLTGTGVDSSNDRAIFSWDKYMGLELVARTGATALLNASDTRTVQTLSVVLDAGNQDGKPSSLGDDGILVFQTQFTDGSTAVVARSITRALADIVGGGGNPPADGQVDGNDFTAFLNAFASDNPMADIVSGDGNEPPDGNIDGNDFQAFLNAFAAGN